ncbi:MAG TPA: hypothetical protein VD763_02555 [Candidatus Saccharimonadales bacterium]|nr:hypothetical protein [Candidatus Saccharimonadales bacterium]
MPAPSHFAPSLAGVWPAFGRRVVFIAVVAALTLLVRPVAVTPAVACSCAMDPDPIASAAADPRTAIFTGTMGAATPEGTPVQLTRWFRGPIPQPVIWLDNAGFEDPFGGMCGTNRPAPVSSEWIFAAGWNEVGLFQISMCSTFAALATEQGQELLATAERILGPPSLAAPSADPAPAAPAGPATTVNAVLIPVLVGSAAVLGILAGLALILRSRRAGRGDDG